MSDGRTSFIDILRNKSDFLKNNYFLVFIFILNLIYSAIILLFSELTWPLTSDAERYAEIARGEVVGPPFSYRIIVPLIVSIFPLELHGVIFLILTVMGLSIFSVVLILFLQELGFHQIIVLLGNFVWMGSYAYQYHLRNFGLVDPIFLSCLMLLFLFLERNNTIAIGFVFVIGFFIKEAMLFFAPFLLLHLFKNRDFKTLVIIMISLSIPLIFTLFRTQESIYTFDRIVQMFEANGIFFEDGLVQVASSLIQLLGSYSIRLIGILLGTLILSFLFLESNRNRIRLLLLVAIVGSMFLFARDWNRMMFLLMPLLIPIGMNPLNLSFNGENQKRILNLIIILCILGWLVIGPVSWLFALDNALTFDLILGGILLIIGIINIYTKETTLKTEEELPDV